MAIIDDKVVAMSFENTKFERGTAETRDSLEKLKKALQFPDAGKGLQNINAAAARVNLGHISAGIDEIRNKLGALSVAGLAIFANLAVKAVEAGARITKALTIQPIVAGFQEYSTNLNAIQTILANTQASGADLNDVNDALNQLNTYSDKTIYNFSQMAKNIGTFTAAGVGLKPAVASIKGIANLAALSGSNSEQASTAMYQLSQAIASGRVSLQDWNSVVNAGMGGTVFQRALAQTAQAMGALKDGSVKLVGPMKNVSISGKSFRESIQAKPGEQSWLTSDVLTKTLQQFTGDLSDAELAAQGFNKEQIAAIQQTAKTAQHAATEVKTITQVFDVARETAGSGWAKTFQLIFGNFTEAKGTFTALSNTINGFINTNAEARNKVIADWKKLGGRKVLIEGIKAVFESLGAILKPIRVAFREIFPAKTGKDLFDLTVKFKAFAEALKPSPKTANQLRRTFAGLFAILDIGKQILGGIVRFFSTLFDSVGAGKFSFLELTATIGDWLVALDKALKKGNALQVFFFKMGVIVAKPIKFIVALGEAIASLFSGFSPGGFSGQIDDMTRSLTPFQEALAKIKELWSRFLANFENSDLVFQKIADAFVKFAQGIGPAIADVVAHMNFELILEGIRTGLLVALVVMLKEFLGKGPLFKQLGKVFNQFGRNFGGGVLKNLSKSLGSVSGTMQAMQTNLKAKTLREIATAIALLAASVVALSFVDPKRLNPAMSAIALMLGELIGAMALMDKFIAGKGPAKVGVVSGAMILLATAIDLLVIAVFAMGKLDLEELKKGLGGVVVLLGTLAAVAIPLGKSGFGMLAAGTGIIALAIGMNILALAVRQLGSMDLKELAKGLGGVAFGLGIIADVMRVMPKSVVVTAAPLIAISFALLILAKAVKSFGAIPFETMVKGLAGIAGALGGIGLAMHAMPLNLPVTAAGLILVSFALGKIAKAIAQMGVLKVSVIAKGILGLATAINALAFSLRGMTGTLAGAAALAVAAAGIRVLVPALVTLGQQPVKRIAKGLGTLAAAMTVIATAGRLMTPAAPALLAFGVALVAVGGALFLAGAGIALVGVGLSAIAVAGPTAVAILIQSIVDFTEAIPKMVTNLVVGLLAMVQAFAKTAPKFVAALVKIFNMLLQVIIKSTPKLVKTIEVLIEAVLKILHDKQDKIIEAGFQILLSLIKGVRRHIREVTNMVADIVVTLIDALAHKADDLLKAGADLLIKILEGVGNNFWRVVHTGVLMAGKIMKGIAQGLVDLVDEGATALIKFLNGIAKVIKKREPEIIAAFSNIGVAIIEGILVGMKQQVHKIYDKIDNIGHTAIKKFKNVFKWGSPSKITMELGKAIIQGLVIGLDRNAPQAYSSISDMSEGLRNLISKINFDELVDTDPKITPVLDLTNVRKGAETLSSLINKTPVGTVSLGQASAISSDQVVLRTEKAVTPTEGTKITLNQTNNSPKALDTVEIYRNSRNQLSTLKALTGIA